MDNVIKKIGLGYIKFNLYFYRVKQSIKTITVKAPKKFTVKESRILKAIKKVQAHLLYLKNKYEDRHSVLTPEQKKEVDQWNDWHDLEWRLEARQAENFGNYQTWHFEEYGFAVYNLAS